MKKFNLIATNDVDWSFREDMVSTILATITGAESNDDGECDGDLSMITFTVNTTHEQLRLDLAQLNEEYDWQIVDDDPSIEMDEYEVTLFWSVPIDEDFGDEEFEEEE